MSDLVAFDLRIQAEMLTLSCSLTRGPDGKFDDTKLAAIIKDACVALLDNCGRPADYYGRIEHPAGSFGARGTPHVMRLHEIMGIEANRRWGVCSLNEFRKVCAFLPSVLRV